MSAFYPLQLDPQNKKAAKIQKNPDRHQPPPKPPTSLNQTATHLHPPSYTILPKRIVKPALIDHKAIHTHRCNS